MVYFPTSLVMCKCVLLDLRECVDHVEVYLYS